MIANCPSCGTHYKHQSPVVPLRARCGRCDSTLDLTRFRPYKIVSERVPTRANAESVANYLPIGLDHPSLATTIAKNVAEPGAAEWQAVPAAAGETAGSQTAATEPVAAEAESGRNENVTFWLWTATAAVLGTAASWTMSGTTLEGLAPGALIGAVAWWGVAAMDLAEVAKDGIVSRPAGIDGCPRCGERWSAGPTVTAPSFGGRALRRCCQCGTRVASGTPSPQLVFSCETCGLPFLADAILPHGEHHCAACVKGLLLPELPDRDVASAAENEVRAALATHWRFVTSPTAQQYLDRIARQVASRIEGAPEGPRIALVDARDHRSLAMPSGTLVISVGLLEFLEDEAELAFVLGHEIAHAASGEAAVRLVRLGFQATARERSASDSLSWSDAAIDLARLGYGRKRERDADESALAALLELEYDPQSVCRYLKRLHAAVARGDAAVAETAVAHPTPFDRLRRVEHALFARVGVAADVPRVNREVFRRALAPPALTAALVPTHLDAPRPLPWGVAAEPEMRSRFLSARFLAAAVVGLAVLAALAAWLGR